MGVAAANDVLEPTARACAAKLDLAGGRRTLLISTYLESFVVLNKENMQLLRKVGNAVAKKNQAVVDGDFSNVPEDMAASGIAPAMGIRVMAP